jgi:hypothetical protein
VKEDGMRIIKLAYEESYSNQVDVSIYGLDQARPGTLPNEARWKASVQFKVSMEGRSWGIKDIHVYPFGTVTVPIEVSPEEDETRTENIDVAFDAGQLPREARPGTTITVGEVDLHLKPDLSVDYERSSITVYEPVDPMEQ